MSPRVQKAFDAAVSDIMAHVAKLNEITCDKHDATITFLMSVIQDPMVDMELAMRASQLMSMFTLLHITMHKCEDIAATKEPVELRKIMMRVVESLE